MHLKNIFTDGELDESATAKDFLAVQIEGKRQVQRNLKHYNLDAIRGCKNFCVNGPWAGTCRIARSDDDRNETRRTC